MTKFITFLGCIAVLAGCEAGPSGPNPGEEGFLAELPEAVATIADPRQDLSAVKLDPVDNCYVYRHRNPVETTLLPLRTREGRPICVRKAEEDSASS